MKDSRIAQNYIGVLVVALCFCFLVSCNVSMRNEIKELEDIEIFSINKESMTIILDGVINSSALDKFKVLAKANPNIKRIEITNCDGSINDEVNLELARYIYDNKYDIHLSADGLIASGGTDLFLAGRNRTKGENTRIGVHSWAGSKKTATDFAVGHKNHLPYIDYYVSVGFTQQEAEEFYYFTINSASADSIHWMTDAEITKYNLTTP